MSLQRPRRRVEQEADVWEAAVSRVYRTLELVDSLAVSFSGGKDSTATLQAVLEVHRREGLGPVRVVFNDEEAIPTETVEYVHRVARRDDVDMRWLCLPFQLRNACSVAEPYWYTWEPEAEDRWCRPLPTESYVVTELPGVTDVPRSERPDFPHSFWRLFDPVADGRVGCCLGIRAQESIMRFRAVTWKKVDNFLTDYAADADPHRHLVKSQPVYDWTHEDIWAAVRDRGWDYNRAYDRLARMGVPVGQQRCSPAFGEEPIQSLHEYAEAFPDAWERMAERVPGVGSAVRYARTPLYGYGSLPAKPDEVRWRDFIGGLLDLHPEPIRSDVRRRVRSMLHTHVEKTGGDPVAVVAPHPVSGLNWRRIQSVAIRGDLKNRRTASMAGSGDTRDAYEAEVAELRRTGRMGQTRW